MDQPQIRQATNFWEKILKDNLGLFTTIMSFVFVAIRLLGVSHGRVETASFLVVHADKIPLILGMILPLLPAFLLMTSMAFLRSFLIRRRTSSASEDMFHFIAITLFAFAGLFLVTLMQLIFAIIMSLILLEIDWMKLLMKVLRRVDTRTVANRTAILRRGTMHSLAMGFLFAVILTPTPWLPMEHIRTLDGVSITGSVVSLDSQFTYIVKEDFNPQILRSSSIIQRSVCEVQGLNDRSVVSILTQSHRQQATRC